MKRTILLTLLFTSFITSVNAQKISAYAITSNQKGQSAWAEVRLVDITTGEEIKTIYRAADEVNILNARTGKPVVKKEVTYNKLISNNSAGIKKDETRELRPVIREMKTLRLDNTDGLNNLHEPRDLNKGLLERKLVNRFSTVQSDKPFATNSAACAYDKRHDRLYYTPLGINQLRYIDLKSKTPAIYYFEDDTFGALTTRFDVANQITRMVIGSDGNGYALTNNGNHLIRFTTNRKAVITDLGALTDDPANGNFSIHSPNGYGGDMIAGNKGNFYVITAHRTVFKIDPNSMVATYIGTIKGLPRGYSTNGAIVEKGTSIIVSSANSTQGYFKFDLSTLQAEPISNQGPVYNASDLANSTLVTEKKNDNKEEVNPEEAITQSSGKKDLNDILMQNKIALYPNPVRMGGTVKLSFTDQPQGRYTIQLMDISGKLIDSRQVNITNKFQVEEYKLPSLILGKGNYLVKVVSDVRKAISVNTIIVQ